MSVSCTILQHLHDQVHQEHGGQDRLVPGGAGPQARGRPGGKDGADGHYSTVAVHLPANNIHQRDKCEKYPALNAIAIFLFKIFRIVYMKDKSVLLIVSTKDPSTQEARCVSLGPHQEVLNSLEDC